MEGGLRVDPGGGYQQRQRSHPKRPYLPADEEPVHSIEFELRVGDTDNYDVLRGRAVLQQRCRRPVGHGSACSGSAARRAAVIYRQRIIIVVL